MMRFVEGAELNGWIVANSVESRNGKDGSSFIKAAMEHIQATLPVEPKRLYFSGSSGGVGVAFENCEAFGGVGVLAFSGHGVSYTLTSKKLHYYFISGATDFNRYGTSHLRKHYKKNAFHRFHEKGHNIGPDTNIDDGMAWLNGRYLEEKESDRAFGEERNDYEKAMLRWVGELQESSPHRALLHLNFLIKEYKISGLNAGKAQEMMRTISEDSNNVRFVEAIFAIDEFSQKHFSVFGAGSEFGHTNEKIQKEAKKLEAEYEGVPEVSNILKNLQKESGK